MYTQKEVGSSPSGVLAHVGLESGPREDRREQVGKLITTRGSRGDS